MELQDLESQWLHLHEHLYNHSIYIATWSTQQLSQVETIFRSLRALPPLSAEVDDHDLRRSMIVKDHRLLVHLIKKSAKENPFKPCSLIFRPSTLHLNSLRWGVWSHMSLWLSNLAFFAFLCLLCFWSFSHRSESETCPCVTNHPLWQMKRSERSNR